jgi:hypothetical protein
MRTVRIALICLVCLAGALGSLTLILHFWPIATRSPDAVVAASLEALQAGDPDGALQWWTASVREDQRPTSATQVEGSQQQSSLGQLAALVDGATVQVSPATYWSHCCEPVQLSDGSAAFASRVEAVLQGPLDSHQLRFYLVDTAHDGTAWAFGLPWTRWWQDPRGRQRWRIASVMMQEASVGERHAER